MAWPLLLLVTSLWVTPLTAQRYLVPEESGPDVVEQVVDMVRASCVFPQDNLLLRRLAYVETRDGTNDDTYGSGFNGGIWRVTRQMYDVTKTASDLSDERSAISEHLQINWAATTWDDLRKPLYSGLAAALFIKHSLNGQTSPVGIPAQQTYWYHTYRASPLNSHAGVTSHTYNDQVNLMEKGCQEGQPRIDIIFALDTSSSISSQDFNSSTQFLINTTAHFNMSDHHTRVAVMTYSNEPQMQINWGQDQNYHDLELAIGGLTYQTGDTLTDKALAMAKETFLAQERHDALKVLVLVTDGESHDVIDTRHAAEQLNHDIPGILVLVVGVGGQVNQDELNDIATIPSCRHTFRVDSYDQIDALTEEILRLTCRAPVILRPGETILCEENSCPPYMVEQPVGKRIKLEFNTTCPVQQTVYGSESTPYPSSSTSSTTSRVSQSHTTVLHLGRNGHSSLQYYNLALGPANRDHCYVALTSNIEAIQVICIDGGQQRACTHGDIVNYKSDTGHDLCH